MFVKCTAKDEEEILAYLSSRPALNLFIIGDIETYGFDSEDQDIWCYREDDHKISGVLLRYKNNIIPAHEANFLGLEAFIACIKEQKNSRFISGRKEALDQYATAFPEFKKDLSYFAECQKLRMKSLQTDYVTDLEVADIPKYIALQEAAFNHSVVTIDDLEKEIASGSAVIKVIKNQQGELVSGGKIAVESQSSGMIVGIATLESARGNGYGSAVVTSLVEHCHNQKKSACLFFTNPAAGSIYHRLGFVDLDRWVLMQAK